MIPLQEVNFHAHSFADPGGRVFYWGDQLYRGIHAASMPFIKELFENGIISNLVEQGLLIGTELTDYTFDKYPLILRHRTVPFASYPQEWCPAMLRDAALTIIELAIALARHSLTLKDAHPWNLLFDTYKPVYVDLGSIAPMDGVSTWPAYPEFCHFCLYPLLLMAQGHDRIARLLMCEDQGVLNSEVFKLAPLVLPETMLWSGRRMMPYLKNRAQRILASGPADAPDTAQRLTRSQKLLLGFLENVRQQVESINLSSFDVEPRAGNDPARPAGEVPGTLIAQQVRVCQILAQLRPASVLDIYSGTGWYSQQAARSGSQVVAFDPDLTSVTSLYREASEEGLPILPLFMDFTKPTPARGLGSYSSMAATDRFQCEMVLALGLLDHPTLDKRIRLDTIIDGLSLFAKRWLVVEFIPHKGGINGDAAPEKSSPHTFEDTISSFERRFRRVTKVLSHSEKRVLLLCEK